jgi:accessory colonization factor AcfC
MRRLLCYFLLICPVGAQAAPSSTLASCREFASLSEAVFVRRDAGVASAQQSADWERIIAGRSDAATARQLMKNILDYAYSPKARAITPKQAKTDYFRGCLASVE